MAKPQLNILFNAEQLAKDKALIVDPHDTVAHARDLLTNRNKVSSINYIYVVNKHQVLVGILSIKELFQATSDQIINKIMQRDIVSVRPTTNPERAAYLALKHNIKAMPVVDKNGLFHGVIESDDILKILYHDFRRDMSRMSGIIPGSHVFKTVAQTSPRQSLRSRLPWIGAGLIGGAFIAQFLQVYEQILLTKVIFVPFIPLVVYIANAVGIQTQTLYIRDESQDPKIKNWGFLIRQIGEGIGIGLVAWISLVVITTFLWESWYLGFIVGMAMTTSILTSVILAVIIPLILIKLKKDPAMGSGPFATIIQDFSSVAIFIFIVSQLT